MQAQLLSPAQVAARLGVHEATMHRLRRDGFGPAYLRITARTVLYDEADVANWIEERKAAGRAEAEQRDSGLGDAVAMWFSQRVDRAAEGDTRAHDLHADFRSYAQAMGWPPVSATAFGRALTAYGLRRKRSNGIVWLGVALKAEPRKAA